MDNLDTDLMTTDVWCCQYMVISRPRRQAYDWLCIGKAVLVSLVTAGEAVATVARTPAPDVRIQLPSC